MVVSIDNRNYMVWGYRLDLFELQKLRMDKTNSTSRWEEFLNEELNWVEKQIEKDIRNNSAWNYRFNIIKEKNMSFEEDFKFVTGKILERITNEAAWNYFNGLRRIHHNEDDQSIFHFFF
jgi:protein farnesyltransferase/geranylgeranyltransferase type-1 subunit alpha